RARRIVMWVVVVVVVITALVAAFAVFTVRRGFPETEGSLRVPGLQAEVQVLRDDLGIPQIYAANQHDLYMAQGYVHAQDRFWQMDVWRHIGAGRLSEMFGESQLDTDRFLRTLGWARVAEEEAATLDPESAAILGAYADGVNAYLAAREGASLSLEYAVLGLTNRDCEPEPWEPLDSLVWVKVMSWDLSGNLDKEIERAVLLNTLTRDQLDDLYPPYPTDHPSIVSGASAQASLAGPSVSPSASSAAAAATPADDETVIAAPVVAAPVVAAPLDVAATAYGHVAGLDSLLAPLRESLGSNSWAVAGSRTATGKPLLSNDTHLGVQMPSIWYQVGLHEGTGTAAGDAAADPDGTGGASSEPRRVNVTGFSFPGAPGVVIGHNDRIAWGFTNVGADVQDLYVEKVNPENPDQYEVDGAWVDMEKVTEEIQVAGGETVTLTVRSTRHGPVISDTFEPLEDVGRPAGLVPDLPEQFALALRWTALEPSNTLRAVRGMNLARDFDEFREAARWWDVPSQNLLYADVDGHIGYQMPGKIPVRSGSNTAGTPPVNVPGDNDGRYPTAGWTGENDWLGYVPFERLPYAFDPPEGYIVTANNAVTPGGAIDLTEPYSSHSVPFPAAVILITYDWHYGYRAQRITDLIEGADHPLEIADMRDIQADDYNLNAENLRPLMLAADLEAAGLDAAARERLSAALDLLETWDLRETVDSPATAFFETFWVHLLDDAFADDLPEDMGPRGGSIWFEVVRRLALEPDGPWWDDSSTPTVEDRDAILVRAMNEAVEELAAAHGGDPSKWSWGDLHTVTFRNQTLGESGIGAIEGLFNRGPYKVPGSTSLVNAENWNAQEPFDVVSLPSMRMIVDLDDLDRSLALHTTGQSGHAYHPHYTDMIDLWRNVDHQSMPWRPESIDTATQDRLTLTP
ncbi:MAG: penicillin acylase family protein, partial [Thermoleophilia bacterium]